MTVAELVEQAKSLSLIERKELIKLLVDTFENSEPTHSITTEKHWRQELNQLLDETDAIEMKYADIEDPVDWVNKLRDEQRKNRLYAEDTD